MALMVVNLSMSKEREEIRKHKDAIANLLLDFSRAQHVAWASEAEALAEVEESLRNDKKRISIVGLVEGTVVGWVAGFQTYSHAFEVHPIVVKPDCQRKGIGRALLTEFERNAASMGALTVYLGTDDHVCATSIGGQDLFPGVLNKAAAIRNRSGHPFEFYLHCGYEIVGILPDVNGKGQPDIWMAKPVGDR